MEISLILGILKAGLDLWSSKEGNKYRDRIIELEKDYHAEAAKPFDTRDQLVIDKCLLEIKVIAKNFIQFNTSNKSK